MLNTTLRYRVYFNMHYKINICNIKVLFSYFIDCKTNFHPTVYFLSLNEKIYMQMHENPCWDFNGLKTINT